MALTRHWCIYRIEGSKNPPTLTKQLRLTIRVCWRVFVV